MTNESNPPKQRGCFFYGCLSLSILGLLAIVLGVVAFFWIKSTTARWIRDYTDTAPARTRGSRPSKTLSKKAKARRNSCLPRTI
jgi:hypothetical protein